MTRNARILVVDDEAPSRQLLSRALQRPDHEVVTAASGDEALTMMDGVHVVVCDYRMAPMDGLALLRLIRADRPHTPVLLVSGSADVAVAVEAMKSGAFDFFERPFDLVLFAERVSRAVELAFAAEEVETLRRRPRRKTDVLVGASTALDEVRKRVAAVARTEVPVAISGETGTGKELIARTIHAQSPRARAPFVIVDCAALPSTLLENELFGHEAGAFTGADRMHPGILGEAAGGTVFIDEIGEMALGTQSKLLRFLQTREFRRIGAGRNTRVDVRVVTATNRDLARAVREETFRQDLYYRINVFPVRVPALRDRAGDVPLLADHFLQAARDETGKHLEGFTAEAVHMLESHAWPGNVRELENAVRRAAVLAAGPRIAVEEMREALELPQGRTVTLPAVAQGAALGSFKSRRRELLEAFERSYVLEALRAAEGNITRAAHLAGLDRKNFWRKVKRYAVDQPAFDESGAE